MDKLRILVAHERPALGQAIRRVLSAQGFVVEVVSTSDAAVEALRASRFDALVLDVALPGGSPCYELSQLAKTGLPSPVRAVILVASVFRRTSYKRRPTQLYGADDYVELHHLGEQLPRKLWRALGSDAPTLSGMVEAEAVLTTFQEEGDQRLFEQRGRAARLAELIVADLILYAGDKLMRAGSASEARDLLAAEIDAARQLYRQINPVPLSPGEDPVGAAFAEILQGFSFDGGEVHAR